MKANISFFIALFVLMFTNASLATMPSTEHELLDTRLREFLAKDNDEARLKLFETRYQELLEQGNSEAEILRIANEGVALHKLFLHDCKKNNKLSSSTIRRIMALNQEKEYKDQKYTEEILTQEPICNVHVLQSTELILALSIKFQEFIHQKQNILE